MVARDPRADRRAGQRAGRRPGPVHVRARRRPAGPHPAAPAARRREGGVRRAAYGRSGRRAACGRRGHADKRTRGRGAEVSRSGSAASWRARPGARWRRTRSGRTPRGPPPGGSGGSSPTPPAPPRRSPCMRALGYEAVRRPGPPGGLDGRVRRLPTGDAPALSDDLHPPAPGRRARESVTMRCTRCGREAAESDKYCAECGMFLRDAFVDRRLLAPLVLQTEGKHREARRELERLVAMEPENALANHLLGSVHFHQGTLDQAIECYQRAIRAGPRLRGVLLRPRRGLLPPRQHAGRHPRLPPLPRAGPALQRRALPPRRRAVPRRRAGPGARALREVHDADARVRDGALPHRRDLPADRQVRRSRRGSSAAASTRASRRSAASTTSRTSTRASATRRSPRSCSSGPASSRPPRWCEAAVTVPSEDRLIYDWASGERRPGRRAAHGDARRRDAARRPPEPVGDGPAGGAEARDPPPDERPRHRDGRHRAAGLRPAPARGGGAAVPRDRRPAPPHPRQLRRPDGHRRHPADGRRGPEDRRADRGLPLHRQQPHPPVRRGVGHRPHPPPHPRGGRLRRGRGARGDVRDGGHRPVEPGRPAAAPDRRRGRGRRRASASATRWARRCRAA